MTRAVFLDRDGVINHMVPSPEGPDSPRSADEFRLLPGVAGAVRKLNQLGLPVVLVSNQPGVAKGKFPAGNLQEMNDRMRADLGKELAVLNGVYYCMHHPEAVLVEYREVCTCRKPKAGLLIQAASEMGLVLAGSYMVGDQPRDMMAGKAVGCTTLFVDSGGLTNKPSEADYACRDLDAAAQLIFQFEGSRVASR